MRRDIEFSSEGLKLRGWLYKPSKGKGPFPTVVMAHGFSGVKEMALDKYAEVFSKAGLAVLVYDNRCLGESEGKPRSDIDPVAQMRDYRSAITFAQMQKECDANRIGIWGTSYTGGTVCAVAGLDKRVKAVVSQVPFMNGVRNLQQFVPVVQMKGFLAMLDEDRQRRVEGKPSQYMKMCSLDASEPHLFPGEQTYNFIHRYLGPGTKSTWENRVTLRSIDHMLAYDVSGYMKLISPTPLLMIVSEFDTCTPTDIALDHYDMVPGPKQLHILKSDHYEAYVEKFDETSAVARDFFVANL